MATITEWAGSEIVELGTTVRGIEAWRTNDEKSAVLPSLLDG